MVPSPNIWHWPEVYEVENRAQDSAGAIWRALRTEADWAGLDVVDVGCGDGFHLPVFAETAGSVLGVEPHPPLVARARQRVAPLPNVNVVTGSAQRLPLPDASADLVHARTAYFFGPGCEPGITEALRVLRPGGQLVVVDLDGTRAPYGKWLCADTPGYHPRKIEKFFTHMGFSCHRIETLWRFPDRKSLVSVLSIEFSAKVAARAISETAGLTIPVGYRLHTLRKSTSLLLP